MTYTIEQYKRGLFAAAKMKEAIDNLRELQAEPNHPFYWSEFGKRLDAIYQAQKEYQHVMHTCVQESIENEGEGKASVKELKEKCIYCFEAKLEYLDEYKETKGDCFIVPFQVLAEDQYKAEDILLEWLSNPKQTGYKFKECVGLIPKPSNAIIMLDKQESEE